MAILVRQGVHVGGGGLLESEDATLVSTSSGECSQRMDIEHVPVDDDPRNWTSVRKTTILLIISLGSLLAGLGAIIYNPAIHEIQSDLRATNTEISFSISLFALLQGTMPFIWSAVGEIKGRKIVYVVSIALYVVGCCCTAVAKHIGVLIGMRCVQAAGSSAVIAIGAATLADIYDPHERGTMMGIYYTGPLLGPSLGLILGGGLTQAFNWRAPFWCLTIISGLVLFVFVFFFKDTFRKERSLAYQAILRRTSSNVNGREVTDVLNTDIVPTDVEKTSREERRKEDAEAASTSSDVTVHLTVASAHPPRQISLTIRDVNPLPPLFQVLRRWNNVAILFASAIVFSFTYCIAYTASRTLASAYGYDSLSIGLILLSYGVGSIAGSIFGGRWSDKVLSRPRDAQSGSCCPETRLNSTKPAMILLPASILTYGWCAEKHIHVASICVALFFVGFTCIWIYSSTIAYIVDANNGRSSTAVACNSMFRGVLAFIATEIAIPACDSIGEGGLYSIWAGLAVVTELLILLVSWKGAGWRQSAELSERIVAR